MGPVVRGLIDNHQVRLEINEKGSQNTTCIIGAHRLVPVAKQNGRVVIHGHCHRSEVARVVLVVDARRNELVMSVIWRRAWRRQRLNERLPAPAKVTAQREHGDQSQNAGHNTTDQRGIDT